MEESIKLPPIRVRFDEKSLGDGVIHVPFEELSIPAHKNVMYQNHPMDQKLPVVHKVVLDSHVPILSIKELSMRHVDRLKA